MLHAGVGTATGVGTTTYISSDTQTSTLSDIETLLGSDTSDEDSEGSEIETVISTVTDVTGKPRTRGGAYKSPEKQPEATQEVRRSKKNLNGWNFLHSTM